MIRECDDYDNIMCQLLYCRYFIFYHHFKYHYHHHYHVQNADGQVTKTKSISAGLDYPGVGPEHAFLKDSGRAVYVPVTGDDDEYQYQ